MKRILVAVLLLSGCRQALPPEFAERAAPVPTIVPAAVPADSMPGNGSSAGPVSAPVAQVVADGAVPTEDPPAEASVAARDSLADDSTRGPARDSGQDAVRVTDADVLERGPAPAAAKDGGTAAVDALCAEVGDKLGSVSVDDCLAQSLKASGRVSVNGRTLALRDFTAPGDAPAPSRILVLGGLHGDEYSSISIMFKWMALLAADPPAEFNWRFLPVANPDGLLDAQAVRQNANGVDLNRNFPSRDWRSLAMRNWKDRTGSNPRRFPGAAPASEPETQWVVEQILAFQPDVIVSVHAPYHLLDYDGPARAPEKIGELYLHQLGVFPGSLGNYAGLDLGLPVVTLELPSAGIMPSRAQIATMWSDLLQWLRKRREEGAS